jgi:hypothetical protein
MFMFIGFIGFIGLVIAIFGFRAMFMFMFMPCEGLGPARDEGRS